MIESESIEQLKNSIDIVDVVSHHVDLKKAGANFKGLCPFHGEKSPSFVVSPAKQIYHCFGCGAGGDAIKFTMETEKLTYPESIEKLAGMYNFSLRYTKGSSDIPKKSTTLIAANEFYQKMLDYTPSAKEYLKDRGIFESTIEKFEIGYAPTKGQTNTFLNREHIAIPQAIEEGLLGVSENGTSFPRFIERITFPIYSASNQVVGFGGRTITNHPAKYVNSAQSKIFNKSKILYAYPQAKEMIHKTNSIIVTEGYMDVVMLHQAGFANAVATLGTALTKEHLPLLRRGNPHVILSYDGDQAGMNAALKASILLITEGFKGGVVIFEAGMDPADMVVNKQTEQLKQLYSHATPLIDFVLNTILSKYNLSDPEQKESALKETQEFLRTLSPILQEEYGSKLAQKLGISSKLLNRTTQTKKRISFDAIDLAELSLIKSFLDNPNLLSNAVDYIDESMFERHKEEYFQIINGNKEHSSLRALELNSDIKSYNDEDFTKQLAFFLTSFYNKKLQHIKVADLSFEKKNFLIRKIRNNIMELKKVD